MSTEEVIDSIADTIVEDITQEGRSPNALLVGGIHGKNVNDLIISKIPPEYKRKQGAMQQIVAAVQKKLLAIAKASQSGNDSDDAFELDLVGGARYTRRKKTKRKKTKRKKTKRKKSVRRKSSKRKKIRKH